jgi:hypothetical protein
MILFYLMLSCNKETCSEEINPSLSLSFVDDTGLEIVPDSVEWYHNGASMGQISNLSSEMNIGSGLVGEFEVIVTTGEDIQVLTYTVQSDECQVITVFAEIILLTVECDEASLPSVIISANDIGGEPLIMDQVTYSVDGGMSQSAECWNGCLEWVAGTEQTGEFMIVGSYTDPSGEAFQENGVVQVGEDECHVLTEEVALEFNIQSNQDCTEIVDQQWVTYFEGQTGCGNVSLYATMAGGFQQLFLNAPGILDQLELNTPMEFDLATLDIELGLQFGNDLDQGLCSTLGEHEPTVTHEFLATSGTVIVELHSKNSQTAVISAKIQNAELVESDCSTELIEYNWDPITIEL